jgi:hypothetical protein
VNAFAFIKPFRIWVFKPFFAFIVKPFPRFDALAPILQKLNLFPGFAIIYCILMHKRTSERKKNYGSSHLRLVTVKRLNYPITVLGGTKSSIRYHFQTVIQSL